jgi:hypothetical protein
MQKKVTIDYMGVELIVIGHYEKAVEAVMYDTDLCGYPGDDATFEANEIFVSDSKINIIEMLINLQLQEIEDLVLIKLEE